MNNTTALAPHSNFKKYVVASLAAHALVLLIFSLKMIFFPDEEINFQNAIRVDIIGLPDKVLPPPPSEKPTEKKETPKPVAVPKAEPVKDTVNLEKPKINLKKKELDALNKLKQLDALSKIESDEKKQEIKKPTYKGNVIAAGTALTGLNKMQADNYVDTVDQHFRKNWSLPEYLKNRSFKTEILVKFDSAGHILSADVTKSSGNPDFDSFALGTVKKSDPVPPPPEKFSAIASSQGFIFGFSE